ncbi:hypothetical protein [Agromyces sp. NPDC058110]|uniref:hypothetical protein n=1 Tax=Agromyces sp. NPDC058110 TaxID=3346345 RepID=UPI0036D97CF8
MTHRPAAAPAVLAAVLALVALLTGCTASSPSPAPTPSETERPVTQEESERLAVARFRVYEQQRVRLSATVPVDGQVLHLDGRADMRAHEATAAVDAGDGRWALLQWTLSGKAVQEVAAEPDLDAALPDGEWTTAPLVADDPLDSALAFVLNLASDRPENPLLLRQNGALLIGGDEVDRVEVDVYVAPGQDERVNRLVTYAVDRDGLLRRVVAQTGGSEPLVVVLEPDASEAVIPLVPDLATPAG